MILIGMVPAYRLFISHKSNPEALLSSHSSLRTIHKFLWNRWYMESFYNKVFLNTGLSLKDMAVKYVENPLDRLLNVDVPAFFAGVNKGLRKVQTGVLSVNLLYFILLFVAILIALRGLGVI
jgi:NADH-quinone oxidoreductase subunit L